MAGTPWSHVKNVYPWLLCTHIYYKIIRCIHKYVTMYDAIIVLTDDAFNLYSYICIISDDLASLSYSMVLYTHLWHTGSGWDM